MHPLARLRGLLVELRRRRVMEVVAIYGGLSFALLQSADLIVNSLGISSFILTTLTLLVLFGFPVVVAIGWIYEIDFRGRLTRTLPAQPREPVSENEAPRRKLSHLSWPARVEAFTIGVVLIAGSWILASRIQRAERLGVPPADARSSYLVSPIRVRSQDSLDSKSADQVSRLLTRQLMGWKNIRVVQSFTLDEMLLQRDVGESGAPTLEQAFEMAEEQNVGTLIGINIERSGDEAIIEAVTYDVERRLEVGDPFLLAGPIEDLSGLVAPVALSLLGLRDDKASLEELRRESRNPLAHRAFERGIDDLHASRLKQAAAHFHDAIREDTLFAIAHYYRALALYWQTPGNSQRLLANGTDIVRHAQAAIESAKIRGVRPGFWDRMEAFRAFWAGDFAGARRAYREILGEDPSDTESWLLLGAVEYNDPMLREVEPDHLVPRGDLNVARAAFQKSADLSPSWQLSFGELFHLDAMLLETAMSLNCPAFEKPHASVKHQDEITEAGDQVAFCPLFEGSIVWVEPSEIDEERQRRAIAAAERQGLESRHLLEDWSQVHPEYSRPHDELAERLSVKRSLLGCREGEAAVQKLNDDIRSELELSLTLQTDTTPEHLAKLAAVYLAMDEVESSRSLLQKALDMVPTEKALPDQAANVFLALDMPKRALDLAEPTWSTLSFAIDDPEGDGFLALGEIARPITELEMYGATGHTLEIEHAFEVLLAEWARLDLSPAQAVHVRRAMLMWVAPALALLPDVRARWFDGWEATGVPVPSVWRAFLALDAEAGSERTSAELDAALNEALSELERAADTKPRSHYVTALLAQMVGRHDEAVKQFLLVESCPLSLRHYSADWGLRILSRWHRAQSYFAMGDSLRGRTALASYAAYRPDRSPE